MIKGICVKLFCKHEVGTDGFGAPIYEEFPHTVENVVVSPVSSEAVISELQLSGKKAVYELNIPKEDTHEWEEKTVEIRGKKYRTIGFLQEFMPENTPGKWNKKIKVERYG